MHWMCRLVALGCMGLSSCAQLDKITGVGNPTKVDGSQADGGLAAYRAAGGRISGVAGFGAAPGAASASVGQAAGITREQDIVWAPENPNQPIQGEEMWKKAENKSWHISHTKASRYARQSGKPMLIWFTDSAMSPLCRQLSSELFSKSEFDDWARERLVRLRIDNAAPDKETDSDLSVRKKKYIEQLKRRYDVHGHPTVVVVNPRGAVVQSYRGYRKGNAGYYFGRIKQAHRIAEREYGEWREKLEARGYRMWESRDGRKLLAKLYHFRPGKVTLIDPDGNRGTTSFSKLCDADQAWIMLQKKRYEARKDR